MTRRTHGWILAGPSGLGPSGEWGGRAEPVRFTRWMQRHVRASWPAFGRRRLRLQVCLFLAAADFRRLLRRRPAIAQRWLTSCAIRLAHSHTRILELLEGSLLPRVARLLLDEAVEGHVLLPQRTLAAMLGVHRQSFNKTLKDLQAQRAIAVAYADIQILDAGALTRVVSGPRPEARAARSSPLS